ncbi:MAG: 1,6-anhydro-N-acetylmuramyl-L-alanine amidase AmpD [Acidiferrobacteraceae bacterium]
MQIRLDSRTGLIEGVHHVASPNWDERPPGVTIDTLVVHAISLPPGQFGGGDIEALFCNRLDPAAHPYYRDLAGLRVSAHLLVRRDGATIQFVSFAKRAWHAGRSRYDGRERVNDFSIGVELEGVGDRPYEDAQYEQLCVLSALLVRTYPAMTPDRIVGHSDIAPGRKTDPGPSFDWQRYRALLDHRLAGRGATP